MLRGGVIGAYALAIALGIFLPVYTDEVGWRFQERAGFDGVDKMFSDGCGINSLAAPPLFMWPMRLASAAINAAFAAPVWVRLSGIGYALAWGLLLLALIRRIAHDRAERIALGIVALALLCLANTPLLLVLSRPEQPIVLATAAALLIALQHDGNAARSRPGGAWLRTLGIVILAAIVLGYHVKALMLMPLFLAMIVMAGRGHATIAARVASGITLVAATGSAMVYWADRLRCPGDPLLRAEYARNSSGMALASLHSWHDATTVLAGLWRNIDPRAYVALAAPEPFPLSEWLPARQIGWTNSARWVHALDAAWLIALALGAIGLVIGLIAMIRSRMIEPRIVFALGLLAAVFGWGATRLVRNFYEAGFLLPLLALAIVFALSGLRGTALRLVRDCLAAILGVVALISVVLTITLWRPSLWAAWQEHGYLDHQGHSIAIRGFPRIERDVHDAARLCSIPPPERARAMLLDDVTYFPYMRSYRPQHQLGVIGLWQGGIRDPIAYLKGKGSSGALVTCRLLPPALRSRAKRSGDICCLGPPRW